MKCPSCQSAWSPIRSEWSGYDQFKCMQCNLFMLMMNNRICYYFRRFPDKDVPKTRAPFRYECIEIWWYLSIPDCRVIDHSRYIDLNCYLPYDTDLERLKRLMAFL